MTIRFRTVLLAGALALGLALPALAGPPDIHKFTSAKIKTLTLDSEVVQENRAELEKIGGDFANAYRFHKLSMAYMQPNKLHFETVVLRAHIAYTINGNKRYTSVPSFHVHKVDDISGSPGKRQTLLDSGLLPPEQLNDYNATFLRKEGGLYVYQLLAKLKTEPFKDIIWIDPKTHITAKRQHFDREGKLVAWYLYKNPVQVRPGIFVPSRVEVYNPENHLAGVTVYTNIKVNLPVDPSLFDF